MSIVKIKKLSTVMQKLAPSSEKIAPHIYEERKQEKELKKEKRKKDFPALKAGKGSTPETTQKSPNLSLGVAKDRKSEIAGVGLTFVENARQKTSGEFGKSGFFPPLWPLPKRFCLGSIKEWLKINRKD